jgi:hypothetical protein
MMEVTMRIVFASILMLTAVAAFDTAKADPYPWCAEYTGGALGGASSCYFMTIEQCRATVSGVGGYCSPNPFYSGPPVQGQTPRRRPRYY